MFGFFERQRRRRKQEKKKWVQVDPERCPAGNERKKRGECGEWREETTQETFRVCLYCEARPESPGEGRVNIRCKRVAVWNLMDPFDSLKDCGMRVKGDDICDNCPPSYE